MKLRFQLFLVVSAFSVSSLFTQNTLKIGVAEGAALSEQKISFELKTAEQQIKATNEELTADIKALENANVVLSEKSSTNLSMMIAEVIASLGLALLFALVFATFWLYLVRYDYELFSAEQSGPHYWQQLLASLQSKNPN